MPELDNNQADLSIISIQLVEKNDKRDLDPKSADFYISN